MGSESSARVKRRREILECKDVATRLGSPLIVAALGLSLAQGLDQASHSNGQLKMIFNATNR